MNAANDQLTSVSQFKNIGFLIEKVPSKILNDLWTDIKSVKENFQTAKTFNDNLAGHLQKEYLLEETIPKINDYLAGLVEKFDHAFDYNKNLLADTGSWNFRLARLWVNFQQKNEFNPVHKHSGAYSFVIWLQIPYNLEDELRVFPEVRGEQKTSKFEFYYTNSLGQIMSHAIAVDKSMEGMICFFPAEMRHAVHPFYTSDDYRISVSGNIKPER